jgi:hypothetical protein
MGRALERWLGFLFAGTVVFVFSYRSCSNGQMSSAAFVAVAYPTRLETRTKESNIRASLRVENSWA